MPHEWNNILVVTKDEVLPWYRSESNLRQTITRYKEKSYGIKAARRGCNGHPMLISFDSLPADIQQGLGDPRKCDHILERFYTTDGGAVSFFNTYRFGDGTYLDTEYQERYITNASVIKAVLKLKEARIRERKTKGGSLTGINATLCADAISFQKTLLAKHKVQHTLPENDRCFKQALNDFETIGYTSLISGKHKNQNTRKVTDKTLSLLNSMFAGDDEKPTATKVHRTYAAFMDGYIEVINNETGEVYDPKDFKTLSDATVKKYMADWVNKIGTYQLRGSDRQKLMQQFKPYHSLSKPKHAGSIISVDDRQPPFKALNGKRLWFYNGIDLGSEAFTCWVYGETKEGIIIEFYRQMVRNYAQWGFNLPAELEAELSLNGGLKESILREGAMFQYVRIEANNARGKRIERYFGNLRYGLEKEREGWLARPFALSESNQPRKAIEQVPMIPYNEIVEGCLRDIETWNNQPHSVHTHMSRWEVFCTMQHPELKPTNWAGILPYIGNKVKSSCNVGIIRLNYGEFLLGMDGKISLGDRLIKLMKQVEGHAVDIYWIDDDEGRVLKAMVFMGTQFICEAIAKPEYQKARIEQTPADLANREIMSAYVATIESFGRRRKQSIDTVTIIDHTPPARKSFVMKSLKPAIADTEREAGAMPEPTVNDFSAYEGVSFAKPLKERF